MTVVSSRKRSPLFGEETSLFFSLVDYRNNYFTSNEPRRIIEFYDGFKNRYQLIQWMRERPKGITNIHEVDGNKEITVVIPTADFHGKFAKNCRENIFKGLQIIFVESGEIPDPYFNYAHNVNVGLQYALKHSPKWIIISNDDMFKMDEVSILWKCLGETPKTSMVILARMNGSNLSYVSTISTFNTLGKLLLEISNIVPFKRKSIRNSLLFSLRKFDIKLISGGEEKNIKSRRFLLKKEGDVWNVKDLAIFRSEFVGQRKGVLFDETFINGYEDLDFTLNLLSDKNVISFIDYKIGRYFGRSLGTAINRSAREVVNLTYFNYKYGELKDLDITLNRNVK